MNNRFSPTNPKAADDTEGHFMGADTVPDELHQPTVEASDTEGHIMTRGPKGSVPEDDTEGHFYGRWSPENGATDEDDTEGHRIAAYGPEGAAADEDDTEGHIVRTRPAPEGSQPNPSPEGLRMLDKN